MFEENREKSTLTEGIRSFPEGKRTIPIWFWILFGLLCVLVFVVLGLYINSRIQLKKANQDLAQQQSDPSVKVRQEAEELTAAVGKLIVLPEDEQPTIATVNDLKKLQDQPFFANAQLGDKVLIYTKARKAILYRPFENKIIELAPLSDASNINQ